MRIKINLYFSIGFPTSSQAKKQKQKQKNNVYSAEIHYIGADLPKEDSESILYE